MVEIITEMTADILNLLQQVSPVTEESAENKIRENIFNYEKLLSNSSDIPLEVYFAMGDTAICALKYQSENIQVREKNRNGLSLRTIPSYLEISDISVAQEHRNKGLSKKLYNFLLETISENSLTDLSKNLLIGCVGESRELLNNLYAGGTYSKTSEFIPRDEFLDSEWDLLGKVRPETIGSQVYSLRLGLEEVGLSKSHGGPIYFSSNLEEICKMRL